MKKVKKKVKFRKDFERRLLRLCDSLNLYFYGCTFRESDGDVHMINRDWFFLWKDADRFEFSTLYSVLSYIWCKNVNDLKKKV